jgi:Mn-dependent DtxR family transcriptional regulator
MTPNDTAGEHSIIARIWLLMLKEGGRWPARELADKLEIKPASAFMAVNAMAMRGYATRYRLKAARSQYEYGVDEACRVPQGVTVKDFQAVLQGEPA